ncbi:hypothetical protein QVD17_18414 [Tagetes erecta]|uniref:Uncharacterized protein n=1 Tax=Tagetes erecta TaxID=13708 RepID=A0AAD8KHQ3_TARER|nr:hypothetical protein QVD17_18414 [Tagetes erecta]
MASKHLLYTFIFYIALISPFCTVAQCPYPCNPPPIPGGNTPPTVTIPPPTTTLPPPTVVTPPQRVFPYNPSTPTFYGGAPPPPDPIVPWFPYYYKDPPRNPNKSLSTDLQSGSMVVMLLIHVVLRLLFS